MTKNGGTLKYRMGRVEKQVDRLDGKVDKVMTNHLPHIQANQSSIRTEVRILAAINIGAIILMKYLL